MSIWGDIAGIGTAIGGFALAPFTGGASIPAGLSAAGAIISGSAVSDAAKKQADATTQALNLQKSMYDTTRSDLAPYSQLGAASLGNLRQLTGLPAAAPAAAPAMASTGAPTAPGQRPAPPNTPIEGTAVPRAQTASGFVTMQAPDGTTNQVDPAHVDYYTRLGAQIVPNASSYAPQQQAVSR